MNRLPRTRRNPNANRSDAPQVGTQSGMPSRFYTACRTWIALNPGTATVFAYSDQVRAPRARSAPMYAAKGHEQFEPFDHLSFFVLSRNLFKLQLYHIAQRCTSGGKCASTGLIRSRKAAKFFRAAGPISIKCKYITSPIPCTSYESGSICPSASTIG